ncbi:MAG: alcohol dehydrogenase catalytic domain-containing protein [Planctomycetia bacterium]|nr:alcohol dehydrogenase catalytic domain-containing protein [Planctomycetia bacterium]
MSVKALQAVGINQVEMTEFPRPEVAEDAILLRNLYCGICGTDLHNIQGKRSVTFPIIPGHELVSEVAEVGTRALETTKVFGGHGLNVGDMVTINPRIVCGKCYYCQSLPSRPQLCIGARTYNSSIKSDEPPHLFGGWAQFLYILPNSEIIKLPKSIGLRVAALIGPLACAVGMLDRYRRTHEWITGDGFGLNRSVVIFGAGAIGMLSAACCHLAGARRVIVIDAVAEKLELARKFGADITIDVTSTTAPERIAIVKEACESLGPEIVVEACGVPETVGEGIEMLRRGGKLYEMGHLLESNACEIPVNLVCRNELEILGNYAYPSSNCLAYAAAILDEGKLPFAELLKFYPLSRYSDVLFGTRDPATVKAVFEIE